MNPNATFENHSTDAAHERETTGHHNVRSLAASAQGLREQARHAADVMREQGAAAKARTTRYVADEPVKSLLVAAAAGALVASLAMLFSSRRGR